MLDELSTLTSATVGTALDALSMRQQLIAANLANASSAGYSPARVDFETALRRELESGGDRSAAETLDALHKLRADINEGHFTSRSQSQGVEIDLEMLRLNETVIRYQALIQGLGKYGSLARMAISGEVKP
jgi:flagellar basal-body rod protein FlgB